MTDTNRHTLTYTHTMYSYTNCYKCYVKWENIYIYFFFLKKEKKKAIDKNQIYHIVNNIICVKTCPQDCNTQRAFIFCIFIIYYIFFSLLRGEIPLPRFPVWNFAQNIFYVNNIIYDMFYI